MDGLQRRITYMGIKSNVGWTASTDVIKSGISSSEFIILTEAHTHAIVHLYRDRLANAGD